MTPLLNVWSGHASPCILPSASGTVELKHVPVRHPHQAVRALIAHFLTPLPALPLASVGCKTTGSALVAHELASPKIL